MVLAIKLDELRDLRNVGRAELEDGLSAEIVGPYDVLTMSWPCIVTHSLTKKGTRRKRQRKSND